MSIIKFTFYFILFYNLKIYVPNAKCTCAYLTVGSWCTKQIHDRLIGVVGWRTEKGIRAGGARWWLYFSLQIECIYYKSVFKRIFLLYNSLSNFRLDVRISCSVELPSAILNIYYDVEKKRSKALKTSQDMILRDGLKYMTMNVDQSSSAALVQVKRIRPI